MEESEVEPKMPNRAVSKGRWGSLHRAVALSIGLCLVGAAVAGSPAKKKLTVEDIMELLAGGVAIPRITYLVKERGIDFQLTPRLQQAFQDAGADQGLIRTIRSQQAAPEATPETPVKQEGPAPQPPGQPPQNVAPTTAPAHAPAQAPQLAGLQIRSRPGNVTIYVDDELKGQTDSEEGRLEVAPLKPGKHRVRATCEGYQDLEGTVEVAAGQMLDTPLWLAKAQGPAPAPAAPELPAGKKFLVRHQHVAAGASGYCQGWLIVNVGYVRYISTDSPHKYLMGTSEIREAKAGSGPGAFFIKLDFGRKYQFVAVDEKGNEVSPGPILAEIHYSMGE
jgi:hypothetical protein